MLLIALFIDVSRSKIIHDHNREDILIEIIPRRKTFQRYSEHVCETTKLEPFLIVTLKIETSQVCPVKTFYLGYR